MTYEYYVEPGYVDSGYFTRINLGTATTASDSTLSAAARRTIRLGEQTLQISWDDIPDDWDAWPRRLGAAVTGRWESSGQWFSSQFTVLAEGQSGIIVNLAGTSTVTSTGGLLLLAESAVSASSTAGAQATRIKQIAAAIQSTAQAVTAAERIKSGTAAYTSVIGQTALAGRNPTAGRAATLAQTQITAQSQVSLLAEAALQGFAAVLSTGTVLSLDPDLTLTIESETRKYRILQEIRLAQIDPATGRYRISGEQRGLAIGAETRQERVI